MAQVVNQSSPKAVPDAVLAAKLSGVPFPNPKTKAEKMANGIARNKRREENRKKRAASAAADLEKLGVSLDPVKLPEDEDKPVISYDTAGRNDDLSESYSSDTTPGVAAGIEPVVEVTLPVKLTRKERRKAEYEVRMATKAEATAAMLAAAKATMVATVVENPTDKEEEQDVCEELAKHGSFAAVEAAEHAVGTDTADNDTANSSTPINPSDYVDDAKPVEVVDEPVVEQPVDEPVSESQPVEAPTEPANEPVVDEPAVEQPAEEAVPAAQPVEAKKPTLTLVSTNPDDPEVLAAKAFYGDTFTPERSECLTKAYSWLNKAIAAETDGSTVKLNMMLKMALKKEAEAFGIVLELSKMAA